VRCKQERIKIKHEVLPQGYAFSDLHRKKNYHDFLMR